MRRSKVLEKIRAGKVARICSLGHVIPAYVKFAAEFGYDGIWFDNEHRAMSDREVQMMLAYFHLHDIDCILRPSHARKISTLSLPGGWGDRIDDSPCFHPGEGA
ncbi:MAG: hypothetical protein R3C11_18625 [Planctomycetaceae bacterium]